MAAPNNSSQTFLSHVVGHLDNFNSSTESALYSFSLDFMFYSLSLIVPLGIICNTVSVIVFTTPQMRRRASSWYLAALAISDNLSLVAITFDYWLKNEKVGLQVMRMSRVACTGVTHLSYSSRLLSAWLVTTFTIERFVAVVYPLRRPSVISVSHARNVIVTETVACVVLSSYTLFTIGIVPDPKGGDGSSTDCDVLSEMATVYVILNVIVLIFGSIVVPIMTIVVLNFVILKRIGVRPENLVPNLVWSPRHLVLHHRHRQQHRQPVDDQPHQQCANRHGNQSEASTSFDLWSPCSHQNHRPNRSIHYRPLRDYSVTTVLLVVSTTFVVLNVPYCVSWFVVFFTHFGLVDSEGDSNQEIAWTLFATKYITSVPYFLNYGLNFVLYSLCARTFRAQLCRTVHRFSICGKLRRGCSQRGRGDDTDVYPEDVLNINPLLHTQRARLQRCNHMRKTVSAPPRIPYWNHDFRFSGQRTSDDRQKTN